MDPITLPAASTKTARWRNQYPDHNKSVDIPQADLLSILQQSGCTGIRLYFALDAGLPDTINMIMVGTDSAGDDLVGGVLRNNISMCPPNCSEGNELNGM